MPGTLCTRSGHLAGRYYYQTYLEIPQELIDNCAREPIHIPGAIQPSGLLFGLSDEAGELMIKRVSDNVAALVGASSAQILGRSLASVLGREAAEAVARIAPTLAAPGSPTPLYSLVQTSNGSHHYDGLLHRSGDLLILELLVAPPDQATSSERLHRFNQLMSRLDAASSVQALCEMAAEEVRAISGFDHVMVYRFSPEWNGEVIAEARAKQSPSYMGHWFPASDIPAQARELYTRNWLRLIPEVAYTPVPITALADEDGSAEPLDLSYSALRSVSPVHIEYLKNMGVRASMSISLLRGGALWGLIACHNSEPILLPLQARLNCEMLGQLLSMKIASIEREAEFRYSEQLRNFRTRLLSYLSGEEKYTEGLVKHDPNLTHIVNSEGAAICTDDVTLVGKTPTAAQCARISDWLTVNAVADNIFFTSSLPRLFAEAMEYAGVASGLLAIPFDSTHKCWVLWFRPEVIKTVQWAGNPEKAIEVPDDGGPPKLHPRRSFASWAETVRMRAHPWSQPEIDAALDLRATLNGLELAASYEREHRIAETLQRSLLSAPPKNAFDGMDIEISYRAAMREAEIGGDYYDVFSLGDAGGGEGAGGRIALVVGDVSGKGLAAASRTAEIKYTLRTYLRDNPDPAAALHRLNTFLSSQQAMDEANAGAAEGMVVPFTFVCIAIAVVDTATGAARIASGGTEPPLLLRGGGEAEEVGAEGMPLGVSSDAEYTTFNTILADDDLLLLVTDGITEARQGKEFLGYDGFIRLTREALPLKELRRIGDTILNGAALYSGGSLRDDACLLMARRSS